MILTDGTSCQDSLFPFPLPHFHYPPLKYGAPAAPSCHMACLAWTTRAENCYLKEYHSLV